MLFIGRMSSIKLDLKDRKILYQLDTDARQSAAAIAKQVGLSKDAVHYRIARLRETGLITRFYAVLNTPNLGFLHFNTLFRFQNLDPQIKQEFIHFCQQHTRIIWCVRCYGSWDFGVSFLGRNLEEYNQFIQEILNKFGQDIQERAVSLIIDSPTYTRTYLINGKEGQEFKYKPSADYNLDEIEHKLLKVLSQQAELTSIELAHKTGLTADIARYRLRQLEKRGIIQGYRIGLNLEKMGLLYYKILFNLKNMTATKEREFQEYCRRNPYIIQFIKYIGNWERQIELEVESETNLFRIVEEIRMRFNEIIKNYEILRLQEEKLNYYPL